MMLLGCLVPLFSMAIVGAPAFALARYGFPWWAAVVWAAAAAAFLFFREPANRMAFIQGGQHPFQGMLLMFVLAAAGSLLMFWLGTR